MPFVSVPAILLILSAPLFAGCGLYFDLGSPSAAGDPAARGAVVTARVFNCRGADGEAEMIPYPSRRTTVTGVAEGWIDGRRMSVPLSSVKLRTGGLTALHGEVPKSGVWVLVLRVENVGEYYIDGEKTPVLGALIEQRSEGFRPRMHLLSAPPGPCMVDTALRRLADRAAFEKKGGPRADRRPVL